MTRFLLIELDPALDRSRRVGIWCRVKQIPGVQTIVDLEACSQETLDTILMTLPVPESVEAVAPVKQEALW